MDTPEKRHPHCTMGKRPMNHAFSKSVLAALLGAFALLVARDATAQGTGGTTGTAAALSWATDFTYYLQRTEDGGKNWIQMNTTEKTYFFNRARCECEADQTNLKGSFRVAIQPAQNTQDKIRALLNQNLVGSGTVRLFAGSNLVNCLTPSAAAGGITLSSYCVNLLNPDQNDSGVEGGMAAIAATNVWYSRPIPVAWLFNSVNSPVCNSTDSCNSITSCTTANATVNIYFWGQTSSAQTPDMQDATIPVNLVGRSAFVPGGVTVKGGNKALAVNWSWPNGLSPSGNQAFLGVQLFCVRGPDNRVFEQPGSFGAAFMTQATTCSNVAPAASTGIGALDPNYLCSGLLPSTSTSYRIEGLQNGIYYGVGVAAIDKFQNASVITDLAYDMPVSTVDFYTEYKDAHGTAQGGYCALARGKRTPSLIGMGALVALGLIGWRRRHGRGPGAGPLAVVFVAGTLGAGQARAQAVYHDDSMIQDRAKEDWKGTPREFAIEARFALYTPAIDSEFSGATKPQSFIFGSQKRPMWQIEFDWEILQVFGTLSLGGVVGYYKENSTACYLSSLAQPAPGSAGTCERSGDNTSLRLIPLAALVVYRFDVLADRWKIPLVPYGKAGLNYTFWNVTDGNGNTPTAGGGKGAGGTAGWQSAVGISLQLDWMDPSAARGFDADAGVNHSYAFFELDTIQSSGLGGSNKLHVGDNTWFAGLMFEF